MWWQFKRIGLGMYFWVCLPAYTIMASPSLLTSWVPAMTHNHRNTYNFFGLHFEANKEAVSCQLQHQAFKMRCVMTGQDIYQLNKPLFEMELVYGPFADTRQRALRRLNRKYQWHKQFSSLTQYVERPIKAGFWAGIAQEARYLRLNNSFWPVLLRAFDVVVHKDALISVTIWADESDWPLVEKEIDEIMRSFKKAAMKR